MNNIDIKEKFYFKVIALMSDRLLVWDDAISILKNSQNYYEANIKVNNFAKKRSIDISFLDKVTSSKEKLLKLYDYKNL